jgi:UDP-N-acetylmuramoyl-L-alanyl-D-glutamate--2,6-diaminopimelate ligase
LIWRVAFVIFAITLNQPPKNIEELVLPSEWLSASLSDNPAVKGLTANSRQVQKDVAFFAISGTKFDGHDFIDDAHARGATVVIVDKPEFAGRANTIFVPEGRAAFARACARWFENPTRTMKLVGVTGTNGKTTSTYLCRHVWDHLAVVSGIIGTIENKIGNTSVPSDLTTPGSWELQSLFSQMRAAGVAYGAMEVSSIALDQWRTLGTVFNTVIFTNLTQDHLDYHGTFENYFASKKRLFEAYGPVTAVVNIDDEWGRKLAAEIVAPSTVVTFSVSDAAADYRATELVVSGRGTSARLKTPAGIFDFVTPLMGRHNLYNALGVIAACHRGLNISLPSILEALSKSSGAPGRLQKVSHGTHQPHVFVDYAHSTDALRNVLNVLVEIRRTFGGKIITVFGCGGDRDRVKRPQMGQVASSLSDITILTSDNPRTEDPERILDEIEAGIEKFKTRFMREVDRRKAILSALKVAEPNDLVLIAGKGHENYQIIGNTKQAFDDAEEVRQFYKR